MGGHVPVSYTHLDVYKRQGYHNIYRVFYGDEAIALEKMGNGYRVLNGYHRLTVAKELGLTTIPARVVG